MPGSNDPVDRQVPYGFVPSGGKVAAAYNTLRDIGVRFDVEQLAIILAHVGRRAKSKGGSGDSLGGAAGAK